ncbi:MULTISPECIES: MucBP domain-containing protein [Paenibacillus]|uniref:MucBP domain-containing protein n=1 Tax=Paenibacillus TaxID=44249 RepID=UPI002FE3EF25
MKRGLKIAVSWLCLFSLFVSPMSVFGESSSSGDPVWPSPGAIQLSKTATPTGKPGEWEITLKAEGKNVRTSSDVVLVIDKSDSMDDTINKHKKMDKAKEAASQFVDHLLLEGADTRIAVVAFSQTPELVSDFKSPGQKDTLKNAIKKISTNGGTNIQAGLKRARDLLAGNSSHADQKFIVLLSDGEPTFSYKGTHGIDYNWPDSHHKFAIASFDYGSVVGTGNSYNLKFDSYGMNWVGGLFGEYKYEVEDNGIGTFSEAKFAKEAGFKIFSVGLDVSNNSTAEKVLKNVKSEGYYSASNEDLSKIFGELAGKIAYAAQEAKVVDPMGEMFNLKQQGAQVGPQDYSVSQGTVTWNAASETFTWDVGNIAEGEPATFIYKVVMDPSKNPVSDVLYPTNGKTTLEYKDVNHRKTSKDFEVPKVSIGNGSILIKGYKVNADGKPVNAEGVQVTGPEFAEALYSEYYKDQNGNEALPVGGAEYSVTAKEIAGYQLKAGDSPVSVKLSAIHPTPTIWFGYAEVAEQTVNVKFMDKVSQKEIAPAQTVKGVIGQKITLEAADVPGYTPENDTVEYTVKAEANEYTFYYTAGEQNVEVRYLELDTEKELAKSTTVSGVTGETVELKALSIPGYTPVEASRSYTFDVENPAHVFYYTANDQSVIVKFVDKESGKELSEAQTIMGLTGKTVTLKAVEIPGYTPEHESYEYTILPEGNEYIFYYTANKPDDNRILTVRYVDQLTGKDLLAPTERTGKVGEAITLAAADYTDTVTGAVYKPHTYETSYTFTEEQVQQFEFRYTLDESGPERFVLIHHVDRETNEEIKAPTATTGIAGKTLVLYPEPITVTDAVYYPEQPEYAFEITPDPEQEFTIYYLKGEPVDLVQLTVSYRDKETGAELAGQDIIKGRIASEIKLTAKQIEGYTPEVASSVYILGSDPNQSYVFYYTKKAPADRQLTVKYLLNGTTEQVASPTVITGKPGETKTLTALSVSGYTPVKSTGTYTFKDQEGQEYIFYYTRNKSNSGGSSSSGSSRSSSSSGITPLPALPPLPAVPPKLETENHYDYINGYPDGTVKPLNNITREEVAAIFYRLLNDESRSAFLKTGTVLSDVEAGRWSNKHISTMENAGVITGYPDGTFKPEQHITRAEFAAIASRFDKLDERRNDKFTDITGHWAEKYIVSAANKGWIKGYADGTFKPDQFITRAEAAKFINSVLNRKVENNGIHKDAKKWPDNIYGTWYYYEIMEATNHHEYTREQSAAEVWKEIKPNRIYP